MQRRGDEALLGQTPEGIEAAAAGKLDGFGIAEGDVAGAVGVGGEEDLPVHLPQQAQKRLGGIRRLPVAAADRTGIDLEDLPCPDQPLHRGACAGRDDGMRVCGSSNFVMRSKWPTISTCGTSARRATSA